MDETSIKKLSFMLAKSCMFTNTSLEPLAKGTSDKLLLKKTDVEKLISEVAGNIYTVLKHPEVEKLPSFWYPDAWEELKDDKIFLEKIGKEE